MIFTVVLFLLVYTEADRPARSRGAHHFSMSRVRNGRGDTTRLCGVSDCGVVSLTLLCRFSLGFLSKTLLEILLLGDRGGPYIDC